MKKIPVGELTETTYFSDSVFLDSGYVLTSPDVPLTNEIRNRLATWGFRSVFSEGARITEPVIDAKELSETGEITRSFLLKRL